MSEESGVLFGLGLYTPLSTSQTAMSTLQTIMSTSKQDFLKKLDEWEHSTTRCTSQKCPIKIEHKSGRYLHCGKRNQREPAFGSCNPPPEVWAAFDRNRAGNGEATDDQVIGGFREAHVYQGHGFLRHTKPGLRPSLRQWSR